MNEQKALSRQALYDNMWLLFALGILLPTVIYTVWGLVEIMNVPQMDVNSAMEALKPVQQAVPAPEAAPVQ